jgi:hypothetical protein
MCYKRQEFYDFPYIGNNIIKIPTDELIFFRGVGIPPTRSSCFPSAGVFFVEKEPQKPAENTLIFVDRLPKKNV